MLSKSISSECLQLMLWKRKSPSPDSTVWGPQKSPRKVVIYDSPHDTRGVEKNYLGPLSMPFKGTTRWILTKATNTFQFSLQLQVLQRSGGMRCCAAKEAKVRSRFWGQELGRLLFGIFQEWKTTGLNGSSPEIA